MPKDSPVFGNLTGEEVRALAYAEPPIQPVGLGPTIVPLVYVMTILSTIVVCGRVWARTKLLDTGQRWILEDYLAVIGYLLFIPAAAFGILGANYGLGGHDADVNEFLKVRAREYALLICVRRLYKHIIWANLVIMFLISGGSTLFVLTDCRPFGAHWNPRLSGDFGFLVISYLGSAIQVVTDWTCAITPFFVVKDLQMATRIKISVIILLGLGIFASSASLMRIVMYQYIDVRKYPDDELFHHAPLIIWSELEGGFAIIACSLPSLRKLFGRHLGSSVERAKQKGSDMATNDRMFRSGGTQLSSFNPQQKSRDTVTVGGKWDRLSDENDENDDSSRIHIIKQTELRVNKEGPNVETWREDDSDRVSR
ncbi:hypothetical protein DL771_008329 [Monosporascus sp. 5C6A]|nr:hypothetical protein DL771_008329 [Monosporascus sp. 5C6A]